MSIESQLKKLTRRLESAREQLRVSGEQLAYLEEVADEAKTEMLVSETPLSERDYNEAQGDVERHRRLHEKLAQEIATIESESDGLLDRLSNPP